MKRRNISEKEEQNRATAREGYWLLFFFFKLCIYIIYSWKLNREQKIENTEERENDTLDKVHREMGGNKLIR